MLFAALSSAVGAVLLVAGIPKVRDRDRMARVVRGYKLLPDGVAPVAGALLPWIEIVIGTALVLGIAPVASGTLAACLFVAFFAGLSINLIRGRNDLDCGCFAFGGGSDEVGHIGWWHSARAAALAAAGIAVTFTPAMGTFERIGGAAIGLLAVTVVCVGVYARSVMSFGRRPIDQYLSNAATEMRAVSYISRY
ncbi:MauE/DoxX family redox-associated membrane protein [Rhodococcus sp. G-MC3]|uniref:MauE/DoxX family redox-associated membrane protein n=1 Tax=Rhodococcus sp. G-MC3 TaxID=3046209 RepID=UPI0024B9405F|nr:MauE/DoxX family redox-associated membrane protein [Rhodococcus sp. G-MC3]MDJ0395103.1 MauE/DoxX family redox-associated membrane protein [Rhodococcus sp. G-MC3]